MAGVLSVAGCKSEEQPPKQRTNAVAAKDSAAVKTTQGVPTVTQAAAAPAPPRDPCAGQELRDPPEAVSLSRAIGGAKGPPALKYGKGRWVWVNVWAAWCEPCKKEMPMLLEWRDKLNEAGIELELAFVSIDDDERELDRFLESQPDKGVRASYWLKGEEAQEEWFESVGFDDTPELPIHVFVTPAEKTACVIKGALDERDYAALAKLVGK